MSLLSSFIAAQPRNAHLDTLSEFDIIYNDGGTLIGNISSIDDPGAWIGALSVYEMAEINDMFATPVNNPYFDYGAWVSNLGVYAQDDINYFFGHPTDNGSWDAEAWLIALGLDGGAGDVYTKSEIDTFFNLPATNGGFDLYAWKTAIGCLLAEDFEYYMSNPSEAPGFLHEYWSAAMGINMNGFTISLDASVSIGGDFNTQGGFSVLGEGYSLTLDTADNDVTLSFAAGGAASDISTVARWITFTIGGDDYKIKAYL